MNAILESTTRAHACRFAVAAFMIVIPPIAPAPADAAEIVPSFGLTRSADSDATKSNVGLALRGGLLGPMFQSEFGVSYRRDEYFDGALETKTIPVTASLLLRPIPSVHADAGVGWYHTKYEYDNPALDDETEQEFGVHVGGGLAFPLAPRAGLDVTGRYVFMKEQESKLVPEKFDPDFWTMSFGLAFKL